ncbi:MAG: peptidase M3 [Holophagae bacterium]|nr:MAG: peptidase M3 [Holophagae bacterium]
MNQPSRAEVETLLAPWEGPYGGLPPFDKATPAAIERAYEIAVARKRASVRAIATNPEPPTFENTVETLEDSGRQLRRVDCLLRVFSATMSTDDMREVEKRLAPLAPALEDDIAHDDALFARIDAVHRTRDAAELTAEQQRLTSVVRDRLLRRGACLPVAARRRLTEINRRIATLFATFNQNLIAEQDEQVVLLDDAGELAGLPSDCRAAAAAAAEARGRPGTWAIANTRPAVWAFLTHSPHRRLRERVWRMWSSRGGNPGERDNRQVIAEIVRLRGEKARLLGFPTYAHYATADRMVRTPDTALDLMMRVWKPVLAATLAQIAELQALADAEGADFQLAPWDRLYYAEKLRRSRFGLDAEALKEYLELEAVLAAMFWAAERLYGLAFTHLTDATVWHADVRAYEVSRAGEPVGVVWFDLLHRRGKMRGSWQQVLRSAERFRGRVLPLSAVFSGVPRPAPGEPVLLPWEYANVLFHEFGHALHMLSCAAAHPSLDSQAVEWDFIELPSLLNERWLLDRELLRRFARHHRTGEPMPEELIDGIEQAIRCDRTTTLTVDMLAPAIADMRLHLLADGRDVDPVALEAEVLRELEMPEAGDLILRMPHAFHTFSNEYAAGVYSYLWADVMAADVADAFLESPGGLWDRQVADRYLRTILSVGASVPAEEAFRDFRGRDPDPRALLRRFGLDAAR